MLIVLQILYNLSNTYFVTNSHGRFRSSHFLLLLATP